MKKGKSKLATDSIILAIVQGTTVLTGLVQSMLLSRMLSKEEYGTYSQGMLVINFVSPFLLLGMSGAINYFYNRKEKVEEYVTTVMYSVMAFGVVGGIIVFLLRGFIESYFDNSELLLVMGMVAIRPLLQNIIACYLPLYVSTGKTKIIAVRNFIISISQIIIIYVAIVVTHSILLIYELLILMDCVQIVIFALYFGKNEFWFKPKNFNISLIKSIANYAIPLALSTMIGTLSINMDKFLIGRMMDTQDFAVYSLMSKELPFDFLITAFTTVVSPAIITCVAKKEYDKMFSVWRNYIELGYKCTWIMISGAIVCASELLRFLYSDTYMEGVQVFIVYLFVSAMRFTYYGIILTAYGKTKLIMQISCMSLGLNYILNIIFFKWIGICGPAVASLIVIVFSGVLMLRTSLKLTGVRLFKLIDPKTFAKFVVSLIVCIYGMVFFKNVIPIKYNTVKLVVCYGINVVALLMLNYGSIIKNIKSLNETDTQHN